MTVRRVSASAFLLTLATLSLVGYVYRHQLYGYLVSLAVLRGAWMIARHKLGWRKPARRGKTLWEIAGAAVAGWLVGRKQQDVLAGAVRNGAEIQVITKPRTRYPRG